MFQRSKEAGRKARASNSNSSRTSRAEDMARDKVDAHRVSCATVGTIWYTTALTGNERGRPLKRSRNRETNFLDPNAHKLWRSGDTCGLYTGEKGRGKAEADKTEEKVSSFIG